MKRHLKNFFIPHEGNDYHPHILHTKRAVFYGSFFVLIKVLVVGVAILLPLRVFVMPDVLQEQVSRMVSYTNQIRAQQGLPDVVAHTALYTSANYKASDMATLGYFDHTGPDGKSLRDWLRLSGYDYQVAGENLAMGFFDAGEVVDAWSQSPTHYANLIDPEFSEMGIAIVAGDFDGVPTAYIAQHFGSPDLSSVDVIDDGMVSARSPSLAMIDSIDVPPVETQARVAGMVAYVDESLVDDMVATDASVTSSESVTTEIDIRENTTTESVATFTATPEQALVADTPIYDSADSYVAWQTVDDKTVLHAHAVVRGDIAYVRVTVKGYDFALYKTDEPTIWEGSLTIFDSADDLFTPITLPSISLVATNGDSVQDSMMWRDAYVVEPSPLEKYTMAKTSIVSFTQLFTVSRGVYAFAIVFFTLALALKILIAYHKQHHHIVLQTVLLIALLVILFEI